MEGIMAIEAILATIISWISTFGLRILRASVILFVGICASKFLIKFLKKSKAFGKLDAAVQTFTCSFLKIAIYVLLALSVANTLGINTTSFITALASAGVAIGLALQGALSNLAGGLMLLIFHPFKVGDFIDAQGYSGTVKKITVFYTFLLTPDNENVMLPNGSLTGAAIKNYSAEDLRRVDLTFCAGYECDSEKVKSVLLAVAESNSLVKQDPAPTARLRQYSDSSVDYFLRVWCDNADYWTVMADMNEAVKKAFEDNNISFPYPQMDIHMPDKQ